MPKLSEEAKAARREAILAAARRCFADFGYEGATVARLEEATGLSRGAIFNYYASKDDLFLALASRDAQRLGTIWAEEGFVRALRAILAEDPAWLSVYLEIGRRLRTDEAFRERYRARAPEIDKRIEEAVVRARADGDLRDDVSLETLGRFMTIVADGLAIGAAAGFPVEHPDELLAVIEEAIRPRATARSRTPARRSAAARARA